MSRDLSYFEGSAPTRHRAAFGALAIASLLGAALVLALGADTTPTTLDSRRLFGLWRMRHVLAAGGLGVLGIAAALSLYSRSMAWSFALATVVGALAFGALELAGRVGLVSWQQVFKPSFGDLGPLGVNPTPSIDVRGTSRMDTASVWGMKTEPMPYHYKTDRRGFRNDVDRDEADVYLIGDSMLVSALVPFDKTLVAQLEARLRKPVMQVALINTAPQTMQQHFLAQRLNVRGKWVVQFIFEGNDLVDTHHLQPRTDGPAPVKWESPSLLDHAWRMAATLSEPTIGMARTRSCSIAGDTYTFFWARESFAGYERQAGTITQGLEAFRQEIEGQGGRHAVVLIPTKLRVLAPWCSWPQDSALRDTPSHLGPLRSHMLAWGRDKNVPVLDLTPALQASAAAGRIPWLTLDTHWNAHGHTAAADALAAWLPGL